MGVPEKTLITGEEILEYIPQRPPVVMVDTFYGIDERGCARSGLTGLVGSEMCIRDRSWSTSPSRPP